MEQLYGDWGVRLLYRALVVGTRLGNELDFSSQKDPFAGAAKPLPVKTENEFKQMLLQTHPSMVVYQKSKLFKMEKKEN